MLIKDAGTVVSIWQPRFLMFAMASGLGIAGMWGQRLVVGWLLWRSTQSGAWLAALGAAELLPVLGVGIVIGAAIDRWEVRRVLIVGQWATTLMAFALLIVLGFDRANAPVLVGIAALSALSAFCVLTARVSVSGLMVAPRVRAQATGLVNMASHIGLAIGPILVGALIANDHMIGAALISAGFLSVSLLIFVVVPVISRATEAHPQTRFLKSLMDGVARVATDQIVRLALCGFLLAVLAGRGLHDVLPALVAETLGGDPKLLGQMIAAGGLGSLAVSIYFIAGYALDQRKQLAAGVLTLSLAFAALATGQPSIALAGCAALGAGLSLNSSATQCLILAHTLPEFTGRVMSVYTMIWRGGPPLGVMTMGLMAQYWPMATLPLIMAVVTFMSAPVIFYGLRVQAPTVSVA